MKKLFLAALALAASIGLSAKDYTVYQDGALAPGLNVYGWWNNATDFNAVNPTGAQGKVMSFKAADGGAAASFGIHSPADNGITGPLHSAKLHFEYYATTAGQKYTIRLTSNVEQNYSFTTTADNIGKWIAVDLDVAETYPGVAAGWKDYVKAGDGYVFSIVLEGGAAESVLYVDNVIYKGVDESWVKPVTEELPVPTTVPVPTHDAANVVSLLSGKYEAACSFGIGGWGQSTQIADQTIDGAPVKKITFFNYLGWELNPAVNVSKCNMMHVDYFAANEGNFGFTPISPGQEKPWIAQTVKVGEWNSYDVPLSHWDNVDLTNVFQVKFDQGNGNQQGYLANVYFYSDGDAPVEPTYDLPASWYGSTSVDTKNENMTDPVHINFDYVLTANEDKTLTVTVTANGDYKSLPGFAKFQINIYGDADEWGPGLDIDEEGTFSRTTTSTFTPGVTNLTPFIWIPYELKGERVNLYTEPYVFGASNEAPTTDPKLTVSAKVDEVTTDGAVISYTVKASNHFAEGDVKVLLNEVEITENPYTITGLDELTTYTYTIKAVGEAEGQTIESNPVELTFKTKSSTAYDKSWYAINDGEITNAYLVGETEDMKRDIPISIETEVTYNTDGTITVTATPHLLGEVVGLVPKITISSGEYKFEYKDMAQENGQWTITTDTEYPEEHAIGWLYYYLAYPGAAKQIDVNGYTTGLENDKPAYGEPTALQLNIAKTGFAVGESTQLSAVAKDAAGHYLFGNDVTYAVEGQGFAIENASLTATAKGKATVTATCGDLTAQQDVICHTSSEAQTVKYEEITVNGHDNANLVFDGNEGTQIVWDCAETEEHNLTIDLGKKMDIEVITLVWEGASATHYTVRLHSDTPAAELPARREVAAKEGHTYTVENGEGGAGVTPRKDLYQDDFAPVAARYVELNTTKAYNAGWGIKLKEMYITGTPSDSSDIMETAADVNAPVEVYNLAGVKVADSTANLPAGIYIVRQGTVTTKTVIR